MKCFGGGKIVQSIDMIGLFKMLSGMGFVLSMRAPPEYCPGSIPKRKSKKEATADNKTGIEGLIHKLGIYKYNLD